MKTYIINDVVASEQDIINEINRVKEILKDIPPDNEIMKNVCLDYIQALQLILKS